MPNLTRYQLNYLIYFILSYFSEFFARDIIVGSKMQ
jgi:hypothetical protein